MTTLDRESFELLLTWLDPDRDIAGLKYEQIRERLIRLFTLRGESEAEELADEVVDRVAKKAYELCQSYQGDPARYFYGVASYVAREHQRKRAREYLFAEPVLPVDNTEKELSCLERCLDKLPSDSRYVVLSYYQLQKAARVDHRKELARNLKIEPNALRARVFRLREGLVKCVKRCLEANGEGS